MFPKLNFKDVEGDKIPGGAKRRLKRFGRSVLAFFPTMYPYYYKLYFPTVTKPRFRSTVVAEAELDMTCPDGVSNCQSSGRGSVLLFYLYSKCVFSMLEIDTDYDFEKCSAKSVIYMPKLPHLHMYIPFLYQYNRNPYTPNSNCRYTLLRFLAMRQPHDISCAHTHLACTATHYQSETSPTRSLHIRIRSSTLLHIILKTLPDHTASSILMPPHAIHISIRSSAHSHSLRAMPFLTTPPHHLSAQT